LFYILFLLDHIEIHNIMIEITQAKNDKDLLGILALQQQNLSINITPEEASQQGFVTVVHDLDILRRMNDAAPHTIAKDGDRVVGYALTMLPQFRIEIPFLKSLFDKLDQLQWNGRFFSEVPYFVMGQVCVSKDCRGMGVFDQLYHGLRTFNTGKFEVVATDISSRNTRSLRAHARVGFQILEELEESGDVWVIVAWGLR
jgi:hypothetical protein